MIIVNVRVPALEKVYNLSIEEKSQVGDLIDEITLLVCQKEGLAFEGDPHLAFGQMSLYSIDAGVQLDRQNTPANYSVCYGAELMLV